MFDELDDWCSGEPEDSTVQSGYRGYWPLALNGMATLLLAFYCNSSIGMYASSYFACQEHKRRVIDLITLAAGCLTGSEALPFISALISDSHLSVHASPSFMPMTWRLPSILIDSFLSSPRRVNSASVFLESGPSLGVQGGYRAVCGRS